MEKARRLLFWQPQKDYLKVFLTTKFLNYLLIFLNYFIWAFLFYIACLLVKNNFFSLGQILVALVISEIGERWIKSKVYWRRPFLNRHDSIPQGLVVNWYRTGSFPSGHTAKAVFFFFLVEHYGVFNPILYWLIIIPLLLFRVVVGFHYPIDLLGGMVIGLISYFFSLLIVLTPVVSNLIEKIFNFLC
ncbi:MAG TPA: phosphatase PAP2 family protein [Candidatus Woesebacteria bacterium]|nr:phosphatase PAP2 family protein [Candidatus Woesebacteria bacterium]HRT39873.1 phosphatase PAP2 family protein [Candidatus Woesebacteria bacterium]